MFSLQIVKIHGFCYVFFFLQMLETHCFCYVIASYSFLQPAYSLLQPLTASYSLLLSYSLLQPAYSLLQPPTASCSLLQPPTASYSFLQPPTASYSLYSRYNKICSAAELPSTHYAHRITKNAAYQVVPPREDLFLLCCV